MPIKIRCNQCGRCCKRWRIDLNKEDIKKVKSLGFKTDYFVELVKNNATLKKDYSTPERPCIFLNKDNSCKIHNKWGYDAKPSVCKRFPHNELVCGIPEISKKKERLESGEDSCFLIVKNKAIERRDFLNLFKNLDTNKPLAESYYNLLLNILDNKENVVLERIDVKDKNQEIPRKIKRRMEKNLYEFHLLSVSPTLNKLIKRRIRLVLPTQLFEFKFNDVEIKKSVKKEFITIISKTIESHAEQYRDYANRLLLSLYFTPYFAKAIAKDKEISIQDMLQGFTLINSLNRFGEIRPVNFLK